MRILYVHNINRVAEIYAAEMERGGHTIKLYEPDVRGGNARLPVKLAMMPRRVLSLRHLIGELKPDYFDLVHIHWASYGILGLLSKIPFVVECHGSDVRHRLRHPAFRRLLSAIFRRAAAVLCITPDLLPIVRSVRPDALFFPGPVDTTQFAPADKPLPDTYPWTVLLFSRLDPEKGSKIATGGLLRFALRHPGARVQLLDWGPLKEEYKQRYSQCFEFLPLVPREQVHTLIASADVVVGQFELGIGFCELQAMSCAKPVICSFRYREAYPLSPPVLQAATAEEVDEQLEALFRHPSDGIVLGQQAREWIMQNHDHHVLTTRLESLYQSILA